MRFCCFVDAADLTVLRNRRGTMMSGGQTTSFGHPCSAKSAARHHAVSVRAPRPPFGHPHVDVGRAAVLIGASDQPPPHRRPADAESNGRADTVTEPLRSSGSTLTARPSNPVTSPHRAGRSAGSGAERARRQACARSRRIRAARRQSCFSQSTPPHRRGSPRRCTVPRTTAARRPSLATAAATGPRPRLTEPFGLPETPPADRVTLLARNPGLHRLAASVRSRPLGVLPRSQLTCRALRADARATAAPHPQAAAGRLTGANPGLHGIAPTIAPPSSRYSRVAHAAAAAEQAARPLKRLRRLAGSTWAC